MPTSLKRYQEVEQLHLIPSTSNNRQPFLRPPNQRTQPGNTCATRSTAGWRVAQVEPPSTLGAPSLAHFKGQNLRPSPSNFQSASLISPFHKAPHRPQIVILSEVARALCEPRSRRTCGCSSSPPKIDMSSTFTPPKLRSSPVTQTKRKTYETKPAFQESADQFPPIR